MTIKHKELTGWSGNLSDKATHKLKYDVWDTAGTATIQDMRAYMLSTLSPTYDDCGLSDLTWEEEEAGNIAFTATYSSRQVESFLKVAWDTTGGNVRMTTSRGTQRYARSGFTAPDFQNTIGVRDGEPEGVDVVVPVMKLVFTYRWPKSAINLAYAKTLAGLVGTTNNGTFYTYAAGELLFLGTTGELDLTSPTEVQYHFAASQNATLSIGGIASVAKQGHQYLWVLFDDHVDEDANRVVKRPLAAYVEQVYGSSNFATFGIGT
jgi:hypothetical protein